MNEVRLIDANALKERLKNSKLKPITKNMSKGCKMPLIVISHR